MFGTAGTLNSLTNANAYKNIETMLESHVKFWTKGFYDVFSTPKQVFLVYGSETLILGASLFCNDGKFLG